MRCRWHGHFRREYISHRGGPLHDVTGITILIPPCQSRSFFDRFPGFQVRIYASGQLPADPLVEIGTLVTRLTILMYHRVDALPNDNPHPKNFVTPFRFREQIEGMLSLGYTPVTFEEWMHYRVHRGKLPHLPFIVTFDDGYADFDRNAWPILRTLRVPATVFLVASKIGGTNDWEREGPRTALLDAVRIRALEAEGVTFGGHGYAHVPLAHVSPNEARIEIEHCRAALVALLSKPPEVFAYPYSNQNATVRRLTREAGFLCAVRGKGRLNARWIDPFGLRRILMHEGVTVRVLRRMLMRLRWMTIG